MSRKIEIEPITRIEGHGKVTLQLGDDGRVSEARFNVIEFRGLEKACEGRLFWEMPLFISRSCGICPVSHHLAGAKAADAIMGVQITPTARKLRELMHMAQFLQSHALHFFHLASPDLLLGFDADPARRNVVGLIAEKPDLAVKGVMLRKLGQSIIRMLGTKSIHPTFAIGGGVSRALAREQQEEILKQIDGAIADAQVGVSIIKDYLEKNREEAAGFASFPSGYMGLTDEDGNLNLYDGTIRMRNDKGAILEDKVDPRDYLSIIEERVEDWTYLKFPYYKKPGCPDGGMYRVGPLGRLNVVDRITTPLAGKEFKEFKKLSKTGIVEGSLYFHYARMIECLYSAERIRVLAEDDQICSTDIYAGSGKINEEGVGVLEAPRGTLFHHFWVDKSGVIKKVNLIVATGNNNAAMNRAVYEVARKYVDGNKLTEGMLNRVEAAIRCYDPCLSCSTHALGEMPLVVQLVSPAGEVLDTVRR